MNGRGYCKTVRSTSRIFTIVVLDQTHFDLVSVKGQKCICRSIKATSAGRLRPSLERRIKASFSRSVCKVDSEKKKNPRTCIPIDSVHVRVIVGHRDVGCGGRKSLREGLQNSSLYSFGPVSVPFSRFGVHDVFAQGYEHQPYNGSL